MFIYVSGAILGVFMLFVFNKSGSFFKSVFTSALGGMGALCAVGAVSYFVPLSLGINLYSIVFGCVFSVPGVIFMLLAKTFLI